MSTTQSTEKCSTSTETRKKLSTKIKLNVQKKKQKSAEGGGATPPTAEAMDSITMATSAVTKDLGTARGICWTLYDYEQYIPQLEAEQCRYIVYGREICPDTKRPHLQGYIYYNTERSLSAFSKKYGNMHVEKQWSTPLHASNYCKEDGDYTERGELPTQGKRTDWAKAVEDLKTKDITEVIEEQPQLLPAQRALREYKNLLLKPKHRDVTVIVLYGEAGTGKTRYAYDNYPDIYSKPRGEWWDGYTGQKTILLDDYYGYLPYCELLRVLDRYPYQVPYKGGFTQAQWDTVIITSNKPPNQWYQTGLTPALRRRLKKTLLVENIDGQTCYTPQEDLQEETDETQSDQT